MHLRVMLPVCAILLTCQGCDKVRGYVSDKLRETRTSGDASNRGESGIEIAESEYSGFVSQKGSLVVVVFGADWCAPCRQLEPVLKRVAADFQDQVMLGKVNVDKARDVAVRNGVRILPDVRFFRDGREVHQFNGPQPESSLRALFTNLTEVSEVKESGVRSVLEKLGLPAKSDGPEDSTEDPAIRPMEKGWMPAGIEKR